MFWRFEKSRKVHYFQALPKIISLKSYSPIAELVPTSEGLQGLKKGKDGSWTRFKAALALLYYRTSKPESYTGRDI